MAEESENLPNDVSLRPPHNSNIVRWLPPGLRDKWDDLTAEEKEAVRRNPPPLTLEDIEEIRRLNPLTEVHPLDRLASDRLDTHPELGVASSSAGTAKSTTRPRKKSFKSLLHGGPQKTTAPEVPRTPHGASSEHRRNHENKAFAAQQKNITFETPNLEPNTPRISSSEFRRRKKKGDFPPGTARQLNFEELAQKFNIPQRDPSTPSNLDAMSSPTIYLSRRTRPTEFVSKSTKGHQVKENNRPQVPPPSAPDCSSQTPPLTFEDVIRKFGEEAARKSPKSPSQLPERPKAPALPYQPQSKAATFPGAASQARSIEEAKRSPPQGLSQQPFRPYQTGTLPIRVGPITQFNTPQKNRPSNRGAPPARSTTLPTSLSQSSSFWIQKQAASPISDSSTPSKADHTPSLTQTVSHSSLAAPVSHSSAAFQDSSTLFDDFSNKSLTVAPTSYALHIPEDPVSLAQPLTPTNKEKLSRISETPCSVPPPPNTARRRWPIDPIQLSPSQLPSFAAGMTTVSTPDLPIRMKSPKTTERRQLRLSSAPIRSPRITKRSSRQKKRPPSHVQKLISESVEPLLERNKESKHQSASDYSQISYAAVDDATSEITDQSLGQVSASDVDLRPAPLNIRSCVLKELESHANDKADSGKYQGELPSKHDTPVNQRIGERPNQQENDVPLKPNISGSLPPAANKRPLPHLLPIDTSPVPRSTDQQSSPITPTKASGARHERKNALLPCDIPKTIAPVTAPQSIPAVSPREASPVAQEPEKHNTPTQTTLKSGIQAKQSAEATHHPKRRPSPLRLTSPTAPLTRSFNQIEAPTTPTRPGTEKLVKDSAARGHAWDGIINGRPDIDTCLAFTRYLAARMADNSDESFPDFVSRRDAAFAWLRRYGFGEGLLFDLNEYPVTPKKGFGFFVAPLWIQETHRYDVLERIKWNACSIFGLKILQEDESFAKQSELYDVVKRLRTLLNIPQVSLHFVGTNSDSVLCRANSPYDSTNPFCNLPNFTKLKRSHSIPAHIILSGPDLIEIFDVQKCLLTRHNAILIAKSNIQFYAGIPIFVAGQPIAVLEMVDQSLRREPLNREPIFAARNSIQAILTNIHNALEPEIPSLDPPTTGGGGQTSSFDSPSTPVSPTDSTSPTSPMPPPPSTPTSKGAGGGNKPLKAKKSAASLREGFKKKLIGLDESSPPPPVPPLPPAPDSSYFEWSDEEGKGRKKGKGKGIGIGKVRK
ncbi:MAG: hypothetical protein Q9160_005819 [Pyrenula sp. 1 TL-2023]